MNILIVHAHPEPASFTSAMKNAAVADFTAAGHSVVVSDLYAMGFNPVASAADFGTRGNADYLNYALEQRGNGDAGTLAPDIATELAKLLAADLVIFSFPLYWFSVPAILKGWIDRVLVSGKTYGGRRIYDQGGLKGKRALLALTTGGRDYMLSEGGIHGDIEDILKPVLQGTLAYTGMTVLPSFVGFHVPYLKQEERAAILENFRGHLARLDQLQPLSFPKLGDFDAQMKPLAK
ncbi:NAD(P)H-dependent oxidoreductase [Nevskia ramosa]|uniref:NAD(P)H-dependent oxidoreductase n=1 Tax=Nevskia ramosa TaxID=64002 RepID=UPI00235571BC|nr:NAD(P)H-dependent oxidoreductase [Nevskia ramosa]